MGLEEEVSGGGDAKEKKGNERKKGGEIGKVEEREEFGRSWGSPAAAPAASGGLGDGPGCYGPRRRERKRVRGDGREDEWEWERE